jgi:hypothetical protein
MFFLLCPKNDLVHFTLENTEFLDRTGLKLSLLTF